MTTHARLSRRSKCFDVLENLPVRSDFGRGPAEWPVVGGKRPDGFWAWQQLKQTSSLRACSTAIRCNLPGDLKRTIALALEADQ